MGQSIRDGQLQPASTMNANLQQPSNMSESQWRDYLRALAHRNMLAYQQGFVNSAALRGGQLPAQLPQFNFSQGYNGSAQPSSTGSSSVGVQHQTNAPETRHMYQQTTSHVQSNNQPRNWAAHTGLPAGQSMTGIVTAQQYARIPVPNLHPMQQHSTPNHPVHSAISHYSSDLSTHSHLMAPNASLTRSSDLQYAPAHALPVLHLQQQSQSRPRILPAPSEPSSSFTVHEDSLNLNPSSQSHTSITRHIASQGDSFSGPSRSRSSSSLSSAMSVDSLPAQPSNTRAPSLGQASLVQAGRNAAVTSRRQETEHTTHLTLPTGDRGLPR